jgi:hypothetical protein
MQHTKLFPAGLTRGRWVKDDSPNGCDSSQGAWLDITMVFFFSSFFFLYRPRFALVLFFLGLAMGIILFFFFRVVDVTSLAFLNSYSLL